MTLPISWLGACRRVLKPNGSLVVSGTRHVIFSVGFAMQQLGFHFLNTITWYKPNASPNLACRTFTHSTEILIWAAPERGPRCYTSRCMTRDELTRALEEKVRYLSMLLYDTNAPARQVDAEVTPYLAPGVRFVDPWQEAAGHRVPAEPYPPVRLHSSFLMT